MTAEKTEPRRLDQIPKAYEPQAMEQRLYRWWEENGYFKPRARRRIQRRTPFVISMPPPNVTGALHLGHALTATLEDIMIRYHRMHGDATLWVPGEDHAGIATQNVVERQLAREGSTAHDRPRSVRRARLGVGAPRTSTASRISTAASAPRATGSASASRWTTG